MLIINMIMMITACRHGDASTSAPRRMWVSGCRA